MSTVILLLLLAARLCLHCIRARNCLTSPLQSASITLLPCVEPLWYVAYARLSILLFMVITPMYMLCVARRHAGAVKANLRKAGNGCSNTCNAYRACCPVLCKIAQNQGTNQFAAIQSALLVDLLCGFCCCSIIQVLMVAAQGQAKTQSADCYMSKEAVLTCCMVSAAMALYRSSW